jgi:hypothetical protein
MAFAIGCLRPVAAGRALKEQTFTYFSERRNLPSTSKRRIALMNSFCGLECA